MKEVSLLLLQNQLLEKEHIAENIIPKDTSKTTQGAVQAFDFSERGRGGRDKE